MKRKREKNYSTGEFAQYFGISKDTLLYYDRIGLFSPKYIAPNGYRQYSASQISTFSILLSVSYTHLDVYKRQDIRRIDDGLFLAPIHAKTYHSTSIMRYPYTAAALRLQRYVIGHIAAVKRQALMCPVSKGQFSHRRCDRFLASGYGNSKISQ